MGTLHKVFVDGILQIVSITEGNSCTWIKRSLQWYLFLGER